MENTNLLLPTASEESKTENTQQSWVDRKCSYQGLLALFFFMNLLNYLERVVISGSSEKILEFVRKSVPTHENTFFGALTSVFICGFSIASILFGYYVTLVLYRLVYCAGFVLQLLVVWHPITGSF